MPAASKKSVTEYERHGAVLAPKMAYAPLFLPERGGLPAFFQSARRLVYWLVLLRSDALEKEMILAKATAHHLRKKNRFVLSLWVLTETKVFRYFITISILVNTIILAMEHAFMSEEFFRTLETMNMVFTFIFGLEVVLKTMTLGYRHAVVRLS